jgi:hypothetical protein
MSTLTGRSVLEHGGRVADLLECLIQISALRETPTRLLMLVRAFSQERWTVRQAEDSWAPVDSVAYLAELETEWGLRLRLMLEADRPRFEAIDEAGLARGVLGLDRDPAAAIARFRSRRLANLERLERCSAADLARAALITPRGETTVADLVAMMLANDVEHVGRIRRGLETL